MILQCLAWLMITNLVLAASSDLLINHVNLSLTSNSTQPVILSLSSQACISLPDSNTRLGNCSSFAYDNGESYVPVSITAKNVFNQSLSIQSADSTSYPQQPMFYDEDDWVWNISTTSDQQYQSINQPVSLILNLTTFPSFIRISDHAEISNYVNVTVDMNYCPEPLQMYYLHYSGIGYIVQCRNCPIGSVIDELDQTVCVACPRETYWFQNQCLQCPANQFQPNSSSTKCYTCTERSDMEECQIGDIPLAIAVIAALASPLVTLAVVMCIIRQRALGRCRCNQHAKQRVVDFDDFNQEFLDHGQDQRPDFESENHY